MNSQTQKLIELLEKSPEPLTSVELANALGLSVKSETVAARLLSPMLAHYHNVHYSSGKWFLNGEIAPEHAAGAMETAGETQARKPMGSETDSFVALLFDTSVRECITAAHLRFSLTPPMHELKIKEQWGPFMLGSDSVNAPLSTTLPYEMKGIDEYVSEMTPLLQGALLFCWDAPDVRRMLHTLFAQNGSVIPPLTIFDVKAIARLLFPQTKTTNLSAFLTEGHFIDWGGERLEYRMKGFLNLIQEISVISYELANCTLLDWLETLPIAAQAFDYSHRDFDAAFLEALPECAGTYFMYDRNSQLLYIGKSKNLQQRVSSYFSRNSLMLPRKVLTLREAVHRIEYRVVPTELEALIAESRAIKAHTPPFNVQLNIRTQSISLKNLMILLPGDEQGQIACHTVNICGEYQRIVLTRDETLDQPLSALRSFFARKGSDEHRGGEICLECTLFHRWINRQKGSIVTYDMDHYTSDDVYHLLHSALQAEEFDSKTKYL